MARRRAARVFDARILVRALAIVGAIVLGIIALALTFQSYIDGFFSSFHAKNGVGGSLQDFGSAGEYFSFVIGVPIALLGAVTAALASGILAQFTSTRDEVTIFQFVEDTMEPVSKSIRTLITSFGQIVVNGNRLIRQAGKLLDRIEQVSKQDGAPLEWSKRVEAAFEAMEPAERDGLKAAFQEIKNELSRWRDEYEALLQDIYGAMFARERIAEVLKAERGTAISYLRATIPRPLHQRVGLEGEPEWKAGARGRAKARVNDPNEYPNDVRQFLSDLIAYHARRTEHDAVRALSILPDNYSTLEFVGATIFSPLLRLKTPLTRGRGSDQVTIEGYFVNVGAAWLITLYQYIPEKTAFLNVFKKIFGDRSVVAENFVELAGPSPRDFVMFSLDDSIAREMAQFPKLIMVATPERTEFYDKARHGPIPDAGYAEG